MKKLKFSGALAGAVTIGALLTGAGASASMPQSPVNDAAATSTAQVHLVTGDVVTLTKDASGRQSASVVKAHPDGVGGVFRTFNIGKDLFVVPQSAAPYLGTTLDPSLFDVTALAQHPQASLRIDVTLRPGAESVRLPGATLHHVDSTHEVGSFTAHSASTFGAALARQNERDLAQHARTAGMFSSIVRIAAVSQTSTASTQRAPHPAATHTLTVKGLDWNGNPDNGDSVNVYNVDDLNLFATTLTFSGGQAQATVPDGNYSLVSFFGDFTNDNIYVVTIPQVSVTKDTTVTLDATDATAPMSVTTPKPAPQPVFIVEWARSDANGLEASYTFSASDAFHFFAAPTKKAPTVGDLHLAVQIRAQSSGAKKAYEYDAKFAQAGKISSDQSYVLKQSDLATINASYAADQPNTTSVDGRFAAFAWESFLFVGDINFTTPTARTEYYNGGADLLWNRFGFAVEQQNPFALLGYVQSPWEHLDKGLKRTEVWNGQPNMPRMFEHAVTWNPALTICAVCATSTNLDLYVSPYGDNSEFHIGFADGATAGLTETQNWTIKADKQTIGQGVGFLQASVPLSSSAKSYTISYDTTRSNPYFVLSTDVNTTWKFAADADLSDLPDGWVCSPNLDTSCGVVPAMTNSYDLGADLLGQIASGDEQGTITIGHLAGASIGAKLQAWFSYDGGKTWTKATVSGGTSGQFNVAFTVPSKGQTDGYGAVRIQAKDQAGGSLKQTVLQAFAVK